MPIGPATVIVDQTTDLALPLGVAYPAQFPSALTASQKPIQPTLIDSNDAHQILRPVGLIGPPFSEHAECSVLVIH